jgi:hypothetical protein
MLDFTVLELNLNFAVVQNASDQANVENGGVDRGRGDDRSPNRFFFLRGGSISAIFVA